MTDSRAALSPVSSPDVAQATRALGMDAQSIDVDAPEAPAAVTAFLAAGRPGLLQLRLPPVRG